jgi:succinate dehydrogenase / fumarate reductase flavoprotein subunit
MPCQHYSMGGIDTNEKCETEIKGFYAAGECACVSVHGANRLGGNSLLETIVFGKLAGFAIDKYLANTDIKPDEKLLQQKKGEIEKKIIGLVNGNSVKSAILQAELAKTMSRDVGIFRKKGELEEAIGEILRIKEQYGKVRISSPSRHMNYELMNAIELEYMLEVAHTIALGAYRREESRGAHYRRDFVKRDDEGWLKHTIARIGSNGEPLLASKKVVITNYKPMERTY